MVTQSMPLLRKNNSPSENRVLSRRENWWPVCLKIGFAGAMLGWWAWLWWFAGRSRGLSGLYSWVSQRLMRDGFSITFGALTVLTALVFTWAWRSKASLGKRIAISCILIVGGIIGPVLTGAYSLIVNMAYPKGWEWDMVRAALITVTPVLCLLTVWAVLWFHRPRPWRLVRYLGLAYLAGWLVLPMLVGGRLRRVFYHFTHPRFEVVLLTLLSLAVVLVASWKMRNQRLKLWVFGLAGFMAGPGSYLTRPMGEIRPPSLPVVALPAGIRNTDPLVALSDQCGNGRRWLTFDTTGLEGFPAQDVHSSSLVIHRIREWTADGSPTGEGSGIDPALTMGWNHPPDADARQNWSVSLNLTDNGSPRYKGILKIEGEYRGVRRQPVVTMGIGSTSEMQVPGSLFNLTLNQPCQFIKHGHTHWWIREKKWSPHGAWAREPWRPRAHPNYARPDWTATFSPPAPYPYSVRSHSEYGGFRSLYGEASIAYTMQWQLFAADEFTRLNTTERERLRAERLAAWENWQKTASLTLHKPVEEIVGPFCLYLKVPEFKGGP